MALIVLLLFITVPIVEIALFIQVGGLIGVWPTIAIVVLTAILGTALLRHQGLGTLRRVQESLEQNRLPVQEMFDGLCLLLAGALLLTPGFFTDAVGLLLFVPPLRAWAAAAIGRAIIARADIHVVHEAGTSGPGPGRGPDRGGPVIDGDYEDVTPDRPDAGGTRHLDGRRD